MRRTATIATTEVPFLKLEVVLGTATNDRGVFKLFSGRTELTVRSNITANQLKQMLCEYFLPHHTALSDQLRIIVNGIDCPEHCPLINLSTSPGRVRKVFVILPSSPHSIVPPHSTVPDQCDSRADSHSRRENQTNPPISETTVRQCIDLLYTNPSHDQQCTSIDNVAEIVSQALNSHVPPAVIDKVMRNHKFKSKSHQRDVKVYPMKLLYVPIPHDSQQREGLRVCEYWSTDMSRVGQIYPGDILESQRFRGWYYHVGIYAGNNEVIHLDHAPKSTTHNLYSVQRTAFEVFNKGNLWRVNNGFNEYKNPRPVPRILYSAASFIGKTVRYHLTKLNCETFAYGARYGLLLSPNAFLWSQVTDLIGRKYANATEGEVTVEGLEVLSILKD